MPTFNSVSKAFCAGALIVCVVDKFCIVVVPSRVYLNLLLKEKVIVILQFDAAPTIYRPLLPPLMAPTYSPSILSAPIKCFNCSNELIPSNSSSSWSLQIKAALLSMVIITSYTRSHPLV